MEDAQRAPAEQNAARGQLLKRLMAVQEDERQYIARQLYDETGQSLATLLLGLKMLGKAPDPRVARQQIEDLQALTARILGDVHRLSVELRPTILDELGLLPALRAYGREYQARYDIQVMLDGQGIEERLPPDSELIVYRIVQEALTNTARYARASAVRITCEQKHDEIAIQVRDNGIGFQPQLVIEQNSRLHLGIMGMHERIGLINGRLAVDSAPGQGTVVSLVLPATTKIAISEPPSESKDP